MRTEPENLSDYTLGLQPYPQKVVGPPKPTPTTFSEVVGALGIYTCKDPDRLGIVADWSWSVFDSFRLTVSAS